MAPIGTATNVPGEPIDVGNEWENTGRPASAPGTVTPIATATNTPGAPIEVGSQPWAFAITPDGKTAYVASWQGGTVTPIAIATNTAGTPIKVGDGPFAITPGASHL